MSLQIFPPRRPGALYPTVLAGIALTVLYFALKVAGLL